jgi:predicted PurR-regulated permease PerM
MKDILRNYVHKHVFKILFAVVLVGLFFYIMLPFVLSIVLGGILAMALTPSVNKLVNRGLKRSTSLLIMSLVLALVILTPAVVFFIQGSKKITELLEHSDFNEITLTAKTSIYRLIDKFSSVYGLDEAFAKAKFDSLAASVGKFLTMTFTDFVTNLPEMFMLSFITLLAVYSFLRESQKIRALFDRYFYFSKANGQKFIQTLELCCREVFFTNIVTGLLQATLVSLGAMVFGIGEFFLIFFITFVASFIPILGAGPVAAVLGISCFLESRTGAGIGMMILAGVAGIADNVIRPFLASRGDVAVHPFVGLLAVIGGVIMYGLPGLFIGPLIASLCFGALPIIVEEYFPHNTDDGAD